MIQNCFRERMETSEAELKDKLVLHSSGKEGWLLRAQLLKGLSETRMFAMKAKMTSTCENSGLPSSISVW